MTGSARPSIAARACGSTGTRTRTTWSSAPGTRTSAGHAPIELRAVIDFGDLTAGDPASDLAVCWLHFTEAGREAFRAALADHALYSPGTWVRARAWAVNYASLMAALPEADPLHAVGVHGIGQLMGEPGTPGLLESG